MATFSLQCFKCLFYTSLSGVSLRSSERYFPIMPWASFNHSCYQQVLPLCSFGAAAEVRRLCKQEQWFNRISVYI